MLVCCIRCRVWNVSRFGFFGLVLIRYILFVVMCVRFLVRCFFRRCLVFVGWLVRICLVILFWNRFFQNIWCCCRLGSNFLIWWWKWLVSLVSCLQVEGIQVFSLVWISCVSMGVLLLLEIVIISGEWLMMVGKIMLYRVGVFIMLIGILCVLVVCDILVFSGLLLVVVMIRVQLGWLLFWQLCLSSLLLFCFIRCCSLMWICGVIMCRCVLVLVSRCVLCRVILLLLIISVRCFCKEWNSGRKFMLVDYFDVSYVGFEDFWYMD